MKRAAIVTAALALTVGILCLMTDARSRADAPSAGKLTIIEPDGKPGSACPLEHTSVSAEVAGFVARVSVKQIFHNPTDKKIEAVYTFPLSEDGAVDDMLMKVGDRVVRGKIKRRQEARRIYEQARERGHVASLLDQERPNIFTQSVANIEPGAKVEITIKYVEVLPYEDGEFTFAFPMVVGPRFIPGSPTGQKGTGWAKDTDRVPDASRITPPVTPEGTRAGHDIDLTLKIDAGVPIEKLSSKLHEVDVEQPEKTKAVVSLKNKKEIPNRDFVLKYLVAGDEVKSGVLTHKDGEEGFVTVILIPPKRVKPSQVAPKEMIFVIDCSGSQSGKPLAKAKETMEYFIEHMNPDDTFNIIDFNQGTRMLFSEPKKNTPEYREKALRYLKSLRAQGGTWMGPAIEEVCKTKAPDNRLRIVTFMTDGYVGNDFEIVSMVKELRGKSRWFPFGTGNSVNRFLLDNMAEVGGGEVEYVLLNRSGAEVAKQFYERIAQPVLTDMTVKYDNITLLDVYPNEVSDLWAQKPLVFKARYAEPGKGTITLKGYSAGKPYEQTLHVTLPNNEKDNESLASLWARAKVDHLMARDYMGIQQGRPDETIKEQIVEVALKHRIMTQFTSFVAVEEAVITKGGKPVKVTVPVEMPDGVSREGVFGENAPAPATVGTFHIRGSVTGKAGSVRQGHSVHGKANYIASRRKPAQARMSPYPKSAPSMAPMDVAAGEPKEEQHPALVRDLSSTDAPTTLSDEKEKAAQVDQGDKSGRTSSQKPISGHVPDREETQRRLAALKTKLSPELIAVVEKGKTSGTFTVGNIQITDGKITVQVWLDSVNDEILEQLKKAGLEISFKAAAGTTVIGEIAVDKLEKLVEQKAVRLIEPVKAG